MEIARRAQLALRVALGSISSSRCQITRALRPKAEQRADLVSHERVSVWRLLGEPVAS